ncbi:MAG: hypothetical protein JWN04_3632 [Myxococcaceae bacterium]|nr:hypothetical protein [Myxococcaceae bacterium]
MPAVRSSAFVVYDGEEDSGSGRERRIGRTLRAFGCLGAVALTAGAYALAKLRRRHQSTEARLESLASRRTLLEQLLEAEWRALTQRP